MPLARVSCNGARLQSEVAGLGSHHCEGQERPFPALVGSLLQAGAAGGICRLLPAPGGVTASLSTL